LKENFYLGFFIKEKQLASQVVFLVKSKHWVLAKIHFFCVWAFFWQDFCSRVLFIANPDCVHSLFFESFCEKSGSVGRPTNPLNSSMGSILWETIVWIYNLTVTTVSQKYRELLQVEVSE
jgi:hypothetical protein